MSTLSGLLGFSNLDWKIKIQSGRSATSYRIPQVGTNNVVVSLLIIRRKKDYNCLS